MIPETCNQCLESLTGLANFYPTWQLEILFGAIQLPGNHSSPRFYKAVFQEFQASHLWEKNELFKFHCCFIIFLARTQVGHVTCCYCILYLLNDAICWQKANQIGGKTGSIFRSFPMNLPLVDPTQLLGHKTARVCVPSPQLWLQTWDIVWHGATRGPWQCLTWKWTSNQTNILSMEDILHQLVGSLSRYLQGFMALRWSCSFFPWFMITTQTCPFCVFVIEFKFPFPNQTGTSKQTNKQRSKEAKKQRKTNKQRNKQPNKQRHEPFFPGPNRPALPRIILRPKNRPSGGGPRATSDGVELAGNKVLEETLVGGFNPSEKY